MTKMPSSNGLTHLEGNSMQDTKSNQKNWQRPHGFEEASLPESSREPSQSQLHKTNTLRENQE